MIIGILLFIVFGAACVYLYSHIMYFEKKVSMMESLVVDMRIAVDSLMSEEHMHGGAGSPEGVAAPVGSIMGAPIAGGAASSDPILASPVMPQAMEEDNGEDKFYTSVLEEAHEQAPVTTQEQGISLEDALQGFQQQEPVASAIPENSIATPVATQPKVGPNYDAMTRAELVALAEQRGLRAKKSMSRSEIIGLLRRSEPTQIQTSVAAGSEDAPGTTSVFPAGASLDGDFPVDLGQNGASLAEATVLA